MVALGVKSGQTIMVHTSLSSLGFVCGGAQIIIEALQIGVGYDKNTSLHLADVRATYPGKHNSTEFSAVFENGERVWKRYDPLFVDGEDFAEIGKAFESMHPVSKVMLGNGQLTFIRQRELVDFAVEWTEKNRN